MNWGFFSLDAAATHQIFFSSDAAATHQIRHERADPVSEGVHFPVERMLRFIEKVAKQKQNVKNILKIQFRNENKRFVG